MKGALVIIVALQSDFLIYIGEGNMVDMAADKEKGTKAESIFFYQWVEHFEHMIV